MRVADALDELLLCAEERLDPPVCRTFKNPGDDAPHDVCQTGPNGTDGQLWVAHLGSGAGWPDPSGEPVTCATPWREDVEVGVVRCAKSKVRDDGSPPSEDQITEDADQQEEDRLALRNAIMCCLGVDGKDLIIVGWEPISPQGGCVGGIWTIVIRDSGCDCGNLESS